MKPTTVITVETVVSMGHRLPTYDGVCSSPHGHNARIVVDINTKGKFLDFKVASDRLKLCVEPLDHAMALRHDDPLLAILRRMGFRTVSLSVEPTTEALASFVFNRMSVFYSVSRATVHETDRYAATAYEKDDSVQEEGVGHVGGQ